MQEAGVPFRTTGRPKLGVRTSSRVRTWPDARAPIRQRLPGPAADGRVMHSLTTLTSWPCAADPRHGRSQQRIFVILDGGGRNDLFVPAARQLEGISGGPTG